MEKEQKELITIQTAIRKWIKKNKNDVCFIGHFISFDEEKMKKNEDVVRDIWIGTYGSKGMLKMMMKDVQDEIKKEKSDFVNL